MLSNNGDGIIVSQASQVTILGHNEVRVSFDSARQELVVVGILWDGVDGHARDYELRSGQQQPVPIVEKVVWVSEHLSEHTDDLIQDLR